MISSMKRFLYYRFPMINNTTNQKLNHQIALQKREYNDGYNEYDVRYDRNAWLGAI